VVWPPATPPCLAGGRRELIVLRSTDPSQSFRSANEDVPSSRAPSLRCRSATARQALSVEAMPRREQKAAYLQFGRFHSETTATLSRPSPKWF